MDKLKIAFYIGKSRENPRIRLWDKFVCLVDGSRFSHAELVLEHYDDGSCLCASSSARDGGIRFKRMILTEQHWEVVDVFGDKDFAIRWMNRRAKRGYDWFGLVRTQIGWAPDNQTRYFCSEAVAEMLGLEDAASYGLKFLYKIAVKKLSSPWTNPGLPIIDITDPH
jgi:hypothetical protein